MKYFTEAWAWGDDETDDQDLIARYNRDLEAAFGRETRVWRFATTIGLNDAYVDRVVLDRRATELRLLLLTGSLQVGYWRTELIYSGLRALEGEAVLRAALSNRPTEVWYDEFLREGPAMKHAFLLAPSDEAFGSGRSANGGLGAEFSFVFDRFDYTQQEANGRELLTAEDESVWRS